MKIPGLGKIASFALNRIVLPAIGRAIADRRNPLDLRTAKDALVKAAEDEVRRRVAT